MKEVDVVDRVTDGIRRGADGNRWLCGDCRLTMSGLSGSSEDRGNRQRVEVGTGAAIEQPTRVMGEGAGVPVIGREAMPDRWLSQDDMAPNQFFAMIVRSMNQL
jgi:hypothetical protein